MAFYIFSGLFVLSLFILIDNFTVSEDNEKENYHFHSLNG